MALIKLTAIPHPDLNGGKPQPVYIDASRVLLILGSHHQHPKIGSVERKREEYMRLRAGAQKLAEIVDGYMPKMDDPIAVGWMRTAQMSAAAVSEAAREYFNALGEPDLHERVDCTEVQLACGTALEHGVMLTRVWVSESPDEVVGKIIAERIGPVRA
jgi:hypothetical protein